MNNIYEIADYSNNNYTSEPSQNHDADYWRLRYMIRAEKKKAFWSGAVIAGLSLSIALLLIVGTTTSGLTFMTCYEFGETFTCRFGGM